MPPVQVVSPPPQPMVPYSPPGPGPQGYQPNYMENKNNYPPYNAPYPPPAPVAVAAAPAPVVVQQQAAAPPKKNRFGGLGTTVSMFRMLCSMFLAPGTRLTTV